MSRCQQQVALSSTQMLLHAEKLQIRKASLQFCNFFQSNIAPVVNVCPNLTRSFSKHANQTQKRPPPLNALPSETICTLPSSHLDKAYLPGTGVHINHDHEGGSPRVRPLHCTAESADTPATSQNLARPSAQFLLVGNCVRAHP